MSKRLFNECVTKQAIRKAHSLFKKDTLAVVKDNYCLCLNCNTEHAKQKVGSRLKCKKCRANLYVRGKAQYDSNDIYYFNLPIYEKEQLNLYFCQRTYNKDTMQFKYDINLIAVCTFIKDKLKMFKRNCYYFSNSYTYV